MGTVHKVYWWCHDFVVAHPHVTLIYTVLLTAYTVLTGNTAIVGSAAGIAWAGAKWAAAWAAGS